MMWPSEYSELKHIEDLLVCGICYEYMDTSLITSCSHNYCSRCIRKYLHYKTQCPTCFTETFEKDLRKNKALDAIILHFSRVKKKLESCLDEQISNVNNKEGDGNNKVKEKNSRINDSPLKKAEDRLIESSSIVKNNASPSSAKSIQKDLTSPSTSGQTNIAMFFTPKSKKNLIDSESSKIVVCPVCKVSVSDTKINRHLDDCLKRQNKTGQVKIEEPKRKPLPKLVFSLMKDAVMRKKLKELGLPSQGDRKSLESRLQRYIIVYNAECDKTNPRPVSELIKQCEEEESVEKRVAKTTSSANKLQINRNTNQDVIEDERRKYLATHKDSFDSLIAMMKNASTPKKPAARRSILDDSLNKEKNSPSKRQAMNEIGKDVEDSDTNDFQPIRYDDADMQTSDSDISCPLQTYSSTDPMKFLNAQFNLSCEGSASHKSSPNRSRSIIRNELELSNDCSNPDGRLDDLSNFSSPKSHMIKCEMANICESPRSRTTIQKRLIISQINEIEKSDSHIWSKSPETVKAETMEEDGEGKTHILHDYVCDFSSNDSVDIKFNTEKSCTVDDFTNKTGVKFSNIEKENINSPTKCGANRVFRKRNREHIQSNTKSIKEAKRPTRYCQSEINEANSEDHILGILHETENGTIRKMPTKKRKEDPQLEKRTTTLRKSSRARLKTSTLVK